MYVASLKEYPIKGAAQSFSKMKLGIYLHIPIGNLHSGREATNIILVYMVIELSECLGVME